MSGVPGEQSRFILIFLDHQLEIISLGDGECGFSKISIASDPSFIVSK